MPERCWKCDIDRDFRRNFRMLQARDPCGEDGLTQTLDIEFALRIRVRL
jgi:hypothetical protein